MDQEVRFPRYDSYRESGFNWLGEIPESWNLKRLGTVFGERKEKVSDKDFPPLSVTKNGILPQLASAAKSDDGDNRKGVREGDFVLYGDYYYEIVKLSEDTKLFGQVQHGFEISARCRRARKGLFDAT